MLEITCGKSLYLAQIVPKSKIIEVKHIKIKNKPGIAKKDIGDKLLPKNNKTSGKTKILCPNMKS